jgi:hypothetical protein
MPIVSVFDDIETEQGMVNTNLGNVQFADDMKEEDINKAITDDLLPRLRRLHSSNVGADSMRDASKGFYNNLRVSPSGKGMTTRFDIAEEGMAGHLSSIVNKGIDHLQDEEGGAFEHMLDAVSSGSLMDHLSKVASGGMKKDDVSTAMSSYEIEGSNRLSELELAGQQDSEEYQSILAEVDLLRNVKKEVPEFKLEHVMKAFESDPGMLSAEMVNTVLADPELLFTGLGWKFALARGSAKVLATASKVGLTLSKAEAGVIAGASGAFAVGAGIGGADSILGDLEKTGEIDPNKALFQGGLSGGFGVLFGGVAHALKGVVGNASKNSGATEAEIVEAITGVVQPKKTAPKTSNDLVPTQRAGETVDGVLGDSPIATRTTPPEVPPKAGELLDNPLETRQPQKELPGRTFEGEQPTSSVKVSTKEGTVVPKSAAAVISRARKNLSGRTFDGEKITKRLMAKGVDKKDIRPILEFLKSPTLKSPRIKSQSGKITTPQLILLTGAAVGTLAIAGSPEPEEMAYKLGIGAAAVIAGAKALRVLAPKIHKVLTTKVKANQTQAVNEYDGRTAISKRQEFQASNTLRQMMPNKEVRKNAFYALDGDKAALAKLSPDDLVAVKEARNIMDTVLSAAQKAGVINSVLNDYVPRSYRRVKGNKDDRAVDKFISGLATKTGHGKQRKYASIEDARAAGLELVSDDIADVVAGYVGSVGRAIAGKNFVESLKRLTDVDGNKLIKGRSSNSASMDNLYTTIDHPAFSNLLVHKELVPSVRLFIQAREPGQIRNAVMLVNMASKRATVALSGFHMGALVESSFMAGTRFLSDADARKGLYGPGRHLAALRDGPAGDRVDFMLMSGLKLGIPDDLNMNDAFYKGLDSIMRVLDNPSVTKATLGTNKVLGIGLDGYSRANRAVDVVMWEKVFTWLKMATFEQKLGQAIVNTNGKVPVEKLGAEIAEFTNDGFGGLNWARLAEETHNKIFRKMALEAGSKNGRELASVLLFAYDWTVSNARIMGKAFMSTAKTVANASHKAVGVKERYEYPSRSDRLFKRTTEALTSHRLHGIPVTPWERYTLRALFLYMTVGGALQQTLTGKPIWENERWDRIDRGDGTNQVFSKQATEPAHAVTDFGKYATNKLGVLPKAAGELLLNKKWLSKYDGIPQIWDPNDTTVNKWMAAGGHLGHKLFPIWANQAMVQGTDAFWGHTAHPIYGETKQMKTERKRKEKKKKAEIARAKRLRDRQSARAD